MLIGTLLFCSGRLFAPKEYKNGDNYCHELYQNFEEHLKKLGERIREQHIKKDFQRIEEYYFVSYLCLCFELSCKFR